MTIFYESGMLPEFEDLEPSISNPIMLLKELLGDTKQNRSVIKRHDRKLIIKQSELLGGMQIWGSNPAVLWTSSKLEESGIHVHGFRKPGIPPSTDETFSFVSIDGEILDEEEVRYYMSQQALSYLSPYLCSLVCPTCKAPHFDQFDLATTPHAVHVCQKCQTRFPSPEDHPLSISNPFLAVKKRLYQGWQELH